MKILHLYKDYYPVVGGIENQLRQLAEAQAAGGHSVTVLVTSPTRHTRIEQRGGVRVILAGRLATVASTPISLALPLALHRERPDVLHLHFPYPLADAAQALVGHARRTVISYHSDIVRRSQMKILRLYAPLLRRTLARADGVIVASPPYLASSPFLAPIAERCTVIPYGIDPARFASADPEKVAAIRQQYGQRLILFVGHLRYYKGVDFLLQALTQIQARLLFAGDPSAQRRAEVEQTARGLGVLDRVTFVGRQTEEGLAVLYRACDVFTLPCVERSEAFGIVQLEAMAAGRPVVSCDVGTGVAWVNQHEVTGLVVAPRQPEQLAAALTRLLDDPALGARLGAAGRERVRRQFTLSQMIAQIQALYERVLSQPGQRANIVK